MFINKKKYYKKNIYRQYDLNILSENNAEKIAFNWYSNEEVKFKNGKYENVKRAKQKVRRHRR